MTLGNQIAELRKEKNMTQETLANALGVSNQAVSKWEASQCCPDIQLLPQIADIFDISLDQLFGREEKKMVEEVKEEKASATLPWDDDDTLRAVIYIGHNLVLSQDASKSNEIVFEYNGAALNIESSFSVICDEVMGNVTAEGNVECNDVAGHVSAGGNIQCDDVEGNVEAGGNITCDNVEGSLEAGGNVVCDKVEGNIQAGGNITCDDVRGDIIANGDVTCDEVSGDVKWRY